MRSSHIDVHNGRPAGCALREDQCSVAGVTVPVGQTANNSAAFPADQEAYWTRLCEVKQETMHRSDNWVSRIAQHIILKRAHQRVFRPSAAASRDGLLESCSCRRRGGPSLPPPSTPQAVFRQKNLIIFTSSTSENLKEKFSLQCTSKLLTK